VCNNNPEAEESEFLAFSACAQPFAEAIGNIREICLLFNHKILLINFYA